MHMADALVAPTVAGTMYVCSAAAAGYSIRKIKQENEPKKIPLMGVMGAFVFAAQMINFTIPATGSSGHLCGGMLLSALLGPYAGFLSMIGVLLIQCLLFADGGILALGCNIWNMAFYGCFVGALFIWKPMMINGINKKKIVTASVLGCVLSLQLGAFSVVLETLASGITELPFSLFLSVMQPIHLAIGLVEGLITAAVLCFVYEARRELFWGVGEENKAEMKQKWSFQKTLATLAVSALVLGGAVSLFASEKPDGLEWSLEKVTGETELSSSGKIYEQLEKIQEKTAALPDYGLKENETAAGTSFSGIVGTLLVIFLTIGGGKLFRVLRGNKKNESFRRNHTGIS